MATTDLTDVDIKLRNAVVRQLDWDPEVDASAIGITAKGGVVTLTGSIDTYAGKLAAERAAKHVRGVRAVANDIGVRLRMEKNDSEIASDAARALALRDLIPEGVQAVVHQGTVTLTGKVSWNYQKISAEDAMRHVRGDLLVGETFRRRHHAGSPIAGRNRGPAPIGDAGPLRVSCGRAHLCGADLVRL